MRASLWEDLIERANGSCECCGESLGVGFERPTVDHFFGRGKAEEDLSTCWVLRFDHHEAKTQSRPDAATWLRAFAQHCARNGYRVSFEKTLRKLEWALVKAQTRDGFEVGK